MRASRVLALAALLVGAAIALSGCRKDVVAPGDGCEWIDNVWVCTP